mmetsp:Transcript_141706/g.395080  ORF Transcript_141706/g.395080 Transcript_141706/m.395080 type:complete len:209 (+) Transcript_141706:294-920(+)
MQRPADHYRLCPRDRRGADLLRHVRAPLAHQDLVGRGAAALQLPPQRLRALRQPGRRALPQRVAPVLQQPLDELRVPEALRHAAARSRARPVHRNDSCAYLPRRLQHRHQLVRQKSTVDAAQEVDARRRLRGEAQHGGRQHLCVARRAELHEDLPGRTCTDRLRRLHCTAGATEAAMQQGQQRQLLAPRLAFQSCGVWRQLEGCRGTG